jgi:hypothetical protein
MLHRPSCQSDACPATYTLDVSLCVYSQQTLQIQGGYTLLQSLSESRLNHVSDFTALDMSQSHTLA